jgi:DNA repair protein RecO (recombination protein O)
LTDALARLEKETDPWLVIRYYEVQLLDLLGYRPHLFECANCAKEIRAEDQFFSAAQGGVLCPDCGAGLPGVWRVSVEALKYLRHFQRSDYAGARRARPVPEVGSEVEALLQHYVTYLLERTLNSPGFIRQIKEYCS